MPGNKGERYCYATGHITAVLSKIRTTGRPDKLDFTYMRDTWLLKNSQYYAVIPLLEDMGLIDVSGAPTELYKRYQNPKLAKQALAEGIKQAYPELFKAIPTLILCHALIYQAISGNRPEEVTQPLA